MSTEKRYYWLKLNENFFQNKEIKRLRKYEDGDTYIIIYLKMLLASLEAEGELIIDGVDDTVEDELSLFLDEDEENIKRILPLLEKMKLIETDYKTHITLSRYKEFVGSETGSAKRVRQMRERNRLTDERNNVTDERNNVTDERNNVTDERNNVTDVLRQCNADVTQRNASVTPLLHPCYTEKEREKDKEKNTDKDIEKDADIEKNTNKKKNIYTNEYTQIIDYLNSKCGTNYRAGSASTQRLINARLNEGYTIEDFYTVIDKKWEEWAGTEWEQYMRPSTLFSPKFEGYLNQNINNKKNASKDNLNEPSDYQKFLAGALERHKALEEGGLNSYEI